MSSKKSHPGEQREREGAVRTVRALATASLAALAFGAALATPARGAGFLEEVDRGRAALLASGAAPADGAGARAAAVQSVIAKEAVSSPAFAIGASLAALDLDLDGDPALGQKGDRALVEQQVRDLLRAQAEAGIGNRTLCLLSGRSNPRSLEGQIRLVEPGWSCGPVEHHH